MSLINQMLQDLEKRRASASERSALPDQVRVLPRSEKSNLLWWLAAAAALAAVALWQFVLPRITVPAKLPSPEAAVDERSGKFPDGPASRLALELAEVPPPDAPAAERAADPIPPAAQSPLAPRVAETQAAGRAPARVITPPVTTAAVVAANSAPAAGASKSVTAVVEAKVAAPTPVAPATVVAAISAPPVSASKPAPAVVEAKAAALATTAAAAPAAAIKPRVSDVAADSRVQSAPANTQIDKRMQQLAPAQLAENQYREAATLLNQGRFAEAQEGFRQALQHNPAHIGARQALFGMLLDAKRNSEAEQVLKDGLRLNPNQSGFAMALARMQIDRGDAAAAIETLQGSLAGAQNSPDYLAFYAALLQRQSRHREAVEQYLAALRLAPQSGVWLMGLGISLQALDRHAEAQDAFRRAKSSNSLSPELQAFVDQRLRQLQ